MKLSVWRAHAAIERIGLAVGGTDNPAARRLYERLGYVAWDGGEFTISWDYEALDGRKGTESEVCIYMFKSALMRLWAR